jgi:hypothetical protein
MIVSVDLEGTYGVSSYVSDVLRIPNKVTDI